MSRTPRLVGRKVGTGQPQGRTETPESATPKIQIYFSDFFGIDPAILKDYGTFDISLVSDLPLFIDPFLLFGSKRPEYQQLHQDIIRYLVFLRDKAAKGGVDQALVRSWYTFKEVNQLWFGYTMAGNDGTGLGPAFAEALHSSLGDIFSNFGSEKVTKASHLEKVCLIRPGVGKDHISDFTARLILRFLCVYTQGFAKAHLAPEQCAQRPVDRARFDYEVERWLPEVFTLPVWNGDYVLLAPRDILTKDETWINRREMLVRFEEIPRAIPNDELRAAVVNYFMSVLPLRRDKKGNEKEPTQKDRMQAAGQTIAKFPQLIDYYIRLKEDHPDEAQAVSNERVEWTEQVFIRQVAPFTLQLAENSPFYTTPAGTLDEAMARLQFLKYEIEHRDGYRIFYAGGKAIQHEKYVQLLYQLVWFGTLSDVNREPNNGRGPVDFAVSRGARDKSLVEFKLAKNKSLELNLQKQVAIYEKANRTTQSIKAIVFFTLEEEERVKRILQRLGLEGDRYIVLIDARSDNKPSGSIAS
jgi:hypothetical protein